MPIIPNTVCPRCHREYPSFRLRCPYCGTKKPREVKRSVPESDSAVRGTEAARQAAEAVNWQMLVGGILLICVIAAVIAIVSVNVKHHVNETIPESIVKEEEIPEIAAETTAVPAPTATPSPSPSPTPGITSIQILLYGQQVDGSDRGFMEATGSELQLTATPYPMTENVEVTWYSTDETCAIVDETGLVTIVGGYGSYCEIVASVGNVEARCPVWGK